MARVYVETSFFSACVTNRTSAQDIARREVSLQWWETQARRHEVFVSQEVARELGSPDYPQSAQALAMIQDLPFLPLTDEALAIAGLLVQERVMPGPAVQGDAIHLGIAINDRMEYLLSWNVKHLANPNKRSHLAVICMRLGLSPPMIVTPDLLQETDDE